MRMQKIQNRDAVSRSHSGQALIVVLAIVLCLMLLAASVQIQVVAQLAASKKERDYERALQMAEAGANAYLYELSHGFMNTTYPFMPPWTALQANVNRDKFPLSCEVFKQRALSGSYKITHYSTSSQQGYFVGHTALTNSGVTVIAYGWSNGVVRRVQIQASALSIFDWAALYGLDSNPESYCIKFDAASSVVGALGGEGLIYFNGTHLYDGPLRMAASGTSASVMPAIQQSGNNIPPGHAGTGKLANPLTHNYAMTISMPPADQAANMHVQAAKNIISAMGVEYFRTHNNNDTGLRYLVKNSSSGMVRELSGSYTVMNSGQDYPLSGYPAGQSKNYRLDRQFQPSNDTLTHLGMAAGESYLGLHIYPGDYFFEQINMAGTDNLIVRSLRNSERPTIKTRMLRISGDPANPNPGSAADNTVRIWIGKSQIGADPASVIESSILLEYPAFASRFKIYTASQGAIHIESSPLNPAAILSAEILALNVDSSGNRYGRTVFNNSCNFTGSIISWQIEIAAGCTITKQSVEPGQINELLTYNSTEWKELP